MLNYIRLIVLSVIISCILIACIDNTKKYEADIAHSNAQIAIAHSNAQIVEDTQTNLTSRLYIQEMAKLATPNYMPLYIILICFTVLAIVILGYRTWFMVEQQKTMLMLSNKSSNYRVIQTNSNQRQVPIRIQNTINNIDGYSVYNEHENSWYVYYDNGELYKIYRPKQITMN